MKNRVTIKNRIDILSWNPKLIAVMNDISKKTHAYISFDPLLIYKRINPSLPPYSKSYSLSLKAIAPALTKDRFIRAPRLITFESYSRFKKKQTILTKMHEYQAPLTGTFVTGSSFLKDLKNKPSLAYACNIRG
jgi:hypothetical protein